MRRGLSEQQFLRRLLDPLEKLFWHAVTVGYHIASAALVVASGNVVQRVVLDGIAEEDLKRSLEVVTDVGLLGMGTVIALAGPVRVMMDVLGSFRSEDQSDDVE